MKENVKELFSLTQMTVHGNNCSTENLPVQTKQ